MSAVSAVPVVGVIVTHNSQEFLPELLASIQAQIQQLDHLVVIDDNSTDQTNQILAQHAIIPTRATSKATNLTTRIAQNFQQGVRQAPPNSIVILGDHDDTWLPHRVQHQVAAFQREPLLAMLASDGRISDPNKIEQTLRTTFPIPVDWDAMNKRNQFAFALRHSIATGGASAIKVSNFTSHLTVPSGWLHDRWWSLAATALGRMALDDEIAINYRITTTQQVGLDSASQQEGTQQWLLAQARDFPNTAAKSVELMKLAILALR